MKSQKSVNMRGFILALTLIVGCLGCILYGCSSSSSSDTHEDFSPVRIGTMPTEDMLPAWVAERDGFFADQGVDVVIESFDSASALSAAIAAGEVDMAMVDIMRAVKLCESGVSVDMEWVTLGTEPSQGVFGVLAPADASYSTLSELAEAVADGSQTGAVGVAANTVPEYVYDMLLKEASIDEEAIPTVEVASLPERYSLLVSGNLAAAALPGSLLELGVSSGLKLLADDSQGENLSSSVMIAREDFADNHQDEIIKVAQAWDEAVSAIASNPAAYSMLLTEKANINSSIADTYPISDYPYALADGELVYPDDDVVEAQIVWMLSKGYLSTDTTYDETTGAIKIG